jgi:hypothetical protein
LLTRERHGEIRPRRTLRHRWRSTWGKCRARLRIQRILADRAGLGSRGILAVLGLLVVPWGRGFLGLLARRSLLAILAVLAHRSLQLVLALPGWIPPMVLALLGLLALLEILAVHCFLALLVGLGVLERMVRLRVLELLAILAVRWVLVGLVGQPVLLGMGGMGLGQRSGTPTELGVLAGRGCLGLLGCRGVLAVLAVLGLRVLLQSSTPSKSRRRYGQCGCGPWGWI